MMAFVALAQIIFSSCLLLYSVTRNDDYGNDIYHLFNDYIKQFNKSYEPGSVEYAKRENAFMETLKRIEGLNSHQNTAVYGINQFSDLTPEEFKRHVLPHRAPKSIKTRKTSSSFWNELHQENFLPAKVDWAFSTVETVEAMYALKTGVLEEWSVQQLIDCAPKPDEGCDGGDTCVTLDWLYRNKVNLVLEKDYPFTDSSGLCKIKRSEKTVKIAANFTCDSFIGEEQLMLYQLAYHGPLIAAVDATQWQDYVTGTIQVQCTNQRNHAVQIVGYDFTVDVPYYVVRNTWGKQFGNEGYLHIAFGNNTCSIAEEVSSLDVI